jgi:hypothetical protein
MKRTIIYVFTPKRLQRDYQSGLRLPDFPLGWIKIGKTSSDNDDEDKWDVAYNRIKQEIPNGLNEPCVLVDVFEYPELQDNPIDVICNMVKKAIDELFGTFCDEQVEQSKYEIMDAPGYIYGVSRPQVMAAITKFERDLLINIKDHDKQESLIDCLRKNDETSINS